MPSAFGTATLLAAPLAAQERLALGATNAQSSHYAYFAALAKLINETYPEKYQGQRRGDGAPRSTNLKRMARGQLDLGLITTSALYHANEGIKTFDGEEIDSLLLWNYDLAPQNVVVRQDAGITSIGGLDGVRFGPGQRGSLDRSDRAGGDDASGRGAGLGARVERRAGRGDQGRPRGGVREVGRWHAVRCAGPPTSPRSRRCRSWA